MSLVGVKFRSNPNAEQKKVLSQWMGCARFVWNAKCEENDYFYRFKQKFLPLNQKTPIDQSYSQFKNAELSPWLSEVPKPDIAQYHVYVARNHERFFEGPVWSTPRGKKRATGARFGLLPSLFRFEPSGAKKRLFIGSKTNNIGYLDFVAHRDFSEPKTIRIKQKNGKFSISFSFEVASKNSTILTQSDHLKFLSQKSSSELEAMTIGVDRGVAIPIHTGETQFDFSSEQKRKKSRANLSIKILQKKLSRQKKGSKQRIVTKSRLGRKHQKIANIRGDFAHKSSFKIVKQENIKVIIFEDLNTKGLTKAPKVKTDASGRFVKNGAAAKAGLNRSILDKSFSLIEKFCSYKAEKAGKAFL
jgi:putative transposase